MKPRKRDEWERRFTELQAFRRRFGHCRVPANWPENRMLAKWAVAQRQRWGHSSIAQLRRLHRLGLDFWWRDREWLEKFFELVAYQRRHGDCRVPQRWRPSPALAHWVVGQRSNERSWAQRRHLDQLGFDWGPRKTCWDRFFEELRAFKQRHDHCRVLKKYGASTSLRYWVANQRGRWRRYPLSAAQKARLDSLGFEWNPATRLQEPIERHFGELQRFKAHFGHCRVPHDWPEDPRLGQWVKNQRSAKLSSKRRQRLQQLGFDWNPFETIWETRFGELLAFQQRFGHCLVPQRWPENRVLASWVESQRQLYRHGQLSKKKQARLNTLEFVWDVPRLFWEQQFTDLKRFKTQHGHCLVPQKQRADRALATWVANQRVLARRDRLSSDQKAKLDALGFVWSVLHLQWEERFAELKQFKTLYGHCRVTQRWRSDRRLWSWVCRQRERRRRRHLPAEQLTRLNALGFIWQPERTARVVLRRQF